MKAKVTEINKAPFYQRRKANYEALLTWIKQAMMEKANSIQGIDHELADLIAHRIALELPENTELANVAYRNNQNEPTPFATILLGIVGVLIWLIVIYIFAVS